MARLEGAYEQINHRLNSIDQRIGLLDGRLTTFQAYLEAQLGALRTGMDQKFLWVIGLILISIVLPLVQRYVAH